MESVARAEEDESGGVVLMVIITLALDGDLLMRSDVVCVNIYVKFPHFFDRKEEEVSLMERIVTSAAASIGSD